MDKENIIVDAIEEFLVFVALVALFVYWQMNTNYLEYDCIRDNEAKTNSSG